MGFTHIPVLLHETITALRIRPEGFYADLTVGGAGHAGEIAKRLRDGGRCFCFDRDADAVKAARERLAPYQDHIRVFHANYEDAVRILKQEGVGGVDGILLDLGVSSHQIDTAERGFSYMQDAPLDMRMDRSESLTAAQIVNTYDAQALARIFSDYGEERFAKRIAERIVAERERGPIGTTFALNDIIYASVPQKARVKGSHPSKRVYQALRIACNRELAILEDSLDGIIGFLNPGGRLCVITFHSLEDRIVKAKMKQAEHPCTCPPSFPVCVCGRQPAGRVAGKPLRPGKEETENNPRASSAKLRVFEKQ
ncbi:MAG: 16S rRNA (cytosine(1402)-N(4))-methyltransferase RsmH [Lachnospiraceae bacterium]|nr:16S rRNA (cytosine(1402)-N(4))-methyltransferase RsmH [Lachnospiraceae bacterium]